MFTLRVNPIASQDLYDIKEYIATEFDNRGAAVGGVNKIIECFEKLKKLPKLGIELSSKIDIHTDYRYLICGNHLVFYKIHEPYISIYRVLNSRREYVSMLFDEDTEKPDQ